MHIPLKKGYKMNIKAFTNGLLSSNSYVVWNDGECMIIDLGVNPQQVSEFISKMDLSVKYLVLTHGHYDHAHYVGAYIGLYPDASVICHENEYKVLTDEIANVTSYVGCPCKYDYDYTFVKDGDIISLGGLNFKVLNMPGHTPGCICLHCESDGVMFTGDVLFAYSYGRTDFKYGSQPDMIASLRKIRDMDKSITIYPGHDECATLERVFGK